MSPLLPADPGLLSDGVVALRLREVTPADPTREWVAAHHYTLVLGSTGEPAGLLSLRFGTSDWLTRYAGQIGYAVAPAYRGRRYASRALRLVAPIAWRAGLVPLWITRNPENLASRRSCELAGAELVEILELPPGNDMYERGDRRKCRYRLSPPPSAPI